MAEKSITITDQAAGVEIACHDAKATAGGLSRLVQVVSTIPAGLDIAGWADTDWIAAPDSARIDATTDLEILLTRMVDTRERSRVMVSPFVKPGFTGVTIVPTYWVLDGAAKQYIGAGSPVLLASSGQVPENGSPDFPRLPIFTVDTFGADFVALYVPVLTGNDIRLYFWPI